MLEKCPVVAEALRLAVGPEERVRVGQDPHEPKLCASSAGSGASKSSWITTAPRSLPKAGADVVATGSNLATGSPRRSMTISSPAMTRSSSRDRWVLASCTPTWAATDLVMDLVY